jgi:uncharacterized protein YraI
MYTLIKASLLTMILLAVTSPSYALDIKIELMVKEFSGGTLNVRNGPGTKYKALRTIRSGTRGMEILKQTGEWVKIGWGKHKGWVNEKYLENVYNIDGAAEYSVNTAKSPLNMRYGPSQKHRKLRALSRGTRGITIVALEKVGKTWWARISHKGKIGWVNTKYLKVATTKTVAKPKRPKAKVATVKKSTKSKYYVVKRGDTLYSVMRKTGVKWRTIASLNRLKAPYGLRLGKKLKIR